MTGIRFQIIFNDLQVVVDGLNRGPSPWVSRAKPYAHKAAEGMLS